VKATLFLGSTAGAGTDGFFTCLYSTYKLPFGTTVKMEWENLTLQLASQIM